VLKMPLRDLLVDNLTSVGVIVGTIGLSDGVSVGLLEGVSVGSGVPHRLPGGSALKLQTCFLNHSMPVDTLE
jgi:hypothetical protein